jgi:hypothetical protein
MYNENQFESFLDERAPILPDYFKNISSEDREEIIAHELAINKIIKKYIPNKPVHDKLKRILT